MRNIPLVLDLEFYLYLITRVSIYLTCFLRVGFEIGIGLYLKKNNGFSSRSMGAARQVRYLSVCMRMGYYWIVS